MSNMTQRLHDDTAMDECDTCAYFRHEHHKTPRRNWYVLGTDCGKFRERNTSDEDMPR